jgi:hypothetical protein
MMKASISIAAVLMLASASVHAAGKPQIQWNEGFDFSAISTFQWKDEAGMTLARTQPFLHSRIVNAIEFELTGTGLTQVDTNPDVYVTYYGSTETEVTLQSDSISYGYGAYGRAGWGAFGYGRTVPVATNTRVVEYERGTLVVDIWNAADNELIWRGVVGDITISDSIEKTEKYILKAIEQMAKQAAKLRAKAE